MKKARSELEAAALSFETKCGRVFIRAMMVLLPLFVLDYFSPFFWFHRRSEIERKFPVQVVRQPQPYTMFGGVKNGILSEDIVLNGRGYMGKSVSVSKPPGEFRIFVLGGSTVFLGDPPISELVEEEFRRRGRENVRLYNYGVVSSVSGMALSRIVFEIADLEPDLVVMYNGGNDMLHPYEYDPRPGYPFNFIVYQNNPLLESDVRAYPGFKLLLYGSNLARSFFPHYFVRQFVPLKQERRKVGWGSDEWRTEVARRYVSNLVKSDRVSNAFGAGFIGFLQPMVCHKDPLSTEEKNNRPDPELEKHCRHVRDRILEQMTLLDKDSVPLLIDLSDVYDGMATTVFIDAVHTTQESKGVVAEAVYQHIVANFEIE
ncbi:MAG: hypothetical protein JSW66_01300 [Phycisphaerales bacterium]|nr:MAG: hypothetical protein JSW66_01300 [Phycisphaerales bacterium]